MKTITAILAVLLVGCEAKVEHSKTPKQESTRFTRTGVSGEAYLSVIRDNQTGKEYLHDYHGSFIEVEPTKRP